VYPFSGPVKKFSMVEWQNFFEKSAPSKLATVISFGVL
jgi:hypothetical protein